MNSKPGSSRYTFADIASFPAASASRLRYCFHTAEDGRIPITNEWPIALAAFAEYAHTYVQVEHDYGQMSVRMTRSEFVDSLVDKPQTTYLKLQAEFTDWHRAWGRLGICNCCGSPGRVTFHNCCGGNFLQISPESGTDLQGWAQFLSGIAVQFDGNSLDSDPVAATADYVLLPQEAKALKLSPDGFFHLLRLMRARGEVLEFSLPRKESSLHNQFVLEGVHLEGGQLIGKGLGVGFVLNLAAVCGYATVNTEAGQELLVIGPEERVLFSVTHHQSSVPQAFWESALVEIV